VALGTLGPMVTPLPARRARQPLFAHPWRVLVVVVVLLVVANLGVLLLSQSDTTRDVIRFPSAIDEVSPRPGELIRPEDTITADLSNQLIGVLVIDRVEIPEDQLDRVVPLGQVSFRPGPTKELTRFDPGAHTAAIFYWPQGKPRPAKPSAYSWSFRSGA
jgi:hypothetical protein